MSHPDTIFNTRLTRHTWISLAQHHRAIAVIRAPEMMQGYQMARAVAAAGMALIEITWNSDRPALLIERLRMELPGCMIGAGTLLSLADIHDAVDAGAQFLFTPHTHSDAIELATRLDTPMIPGALSPTEILTAWQAGAASVKVFPIQAMGGAAYLNQLRGPLGDIPLIPTGGVTLANATTFLKAGAIAVGLSGGLFPPAAIAAQDWGAITQHARTLLNDLAAFRL